MLRRALPASRRPKALLVALTAATLAATGTVTAAPAAAAPAVVEAKPTLMYGSRGEAVAWVQDLVGDDPANGFFGLQTRNAVIAFQKSRRLHGDGIVGGQTWDALIALEASRRTPNPSRSSSRKLVPGTAAFSEAAMEEAAETAEGARYVYGGTGPKTFDCSGYTGYVYRELGISLPRTSGQIREATDNLSSSRVTPGDLFFVHTRGRVTHVGIVAGGGYWWEASNPRSGVGKHRAWSTSVSYGRA